MDYAEENSYMRTSQLPQPSRITSPIKGLSEITESQSNARSKPASRMLPPGSLKHKIGASYNEPDPKRKTLAERAGEPRSMAPPPSSTRYTVKGTSLVKGNAMNHSRNTSFSSSTSSRAPSVNSSRNTSFSSSVGPGTRPTSYGARPQTSMAFSQSTSTRPKSFQRPRAATSMANHSEEEDYDDIPRKGKGTGMTPLPSSSSFIQSAEGYSTLQIKKSRDSTPKYSLKSLRSIGSMRDVSVSTAMSRVRIDEEQLPSQSKEHHSSVRRVIPQTNQGLSHKSSLNTGQRKLRIDSEQNALVLFQVPGDSLVAPKTPSQIPVLSKMGPVLATPSTPCKTPKSSPCRPLFLTKGSNIMGFTDFDVQGRLESIETLFSDLKDKFSGTNVERIGLDEVVALYKARVQELELLRTQLSATNNGLQADLDAARQRSNTLHDRLSTATANFDEQVRAHRLELDDSRRDHRNDIDQLRRDNTDEIERLLRLHKNELRELERRTADELEDKVRELERRNDDRFDEERARRLREVQELESQINSGHQHLNIALQQKDLDIQNMRGHLENVKGELDREQTLKVNAQNALSELKETLQKTGAESTSIIQSLENTISSLRAKIHFLESGSKAQSDSFADMESRLQDAVRSAEVSKQKLIKEETLRRILFNQVQELKGNIRVMCRVRPVFANGGEGEAAKLTFPDVDKESKELEILGREEKSSLGTITRKNHSFTFDRVFGPESQNQEVFEEISQLVQSALDGYNVCIFCYGQTGSGKTHTMSSADGMIPRATHQIYETATNLQEKGWTYTMEGSFVEVYNEEIHDLLGSSKDADKKKHEIKHDEQKKQTVVTGLKTVTLDSPNTVESILKQAAANRSVAATKSNERSSRSHSVFILKLVGRNSTTNETSEGTLNLVDLAGSERLKQSGAEGDRMKETQNINKSLSCLGDVIGALGQGKEGAHIPYRNSKLTYLLQYSLGGNSKTLMFVMASPLEAHLSETLTSLKFATKVHNTHIGTARKSTKIRERSCES